MKSKNLASFPMCSPIPIIKLIKIHSIFSPELLKSKKT